MSNNIKIAIIGCGKQAPKHIQGLKKIPGVEIVLSDLYVEAAKDLAGKNDLSWLPTVDAVFEDSSIDAVSICTPTPSHAPLIQKAVETGKDFLCEKPLCAGREELDLIQNAVKKHNRVGMVGYIYRFSPVFEEAKKVLEGADRTGSSLELGKIVTASFRLGGRGSHQLWKHRKENGGGAINEMLVHMFDLAIWYFGPVKSVEVLACDLLRPKRIIQGREEDVDAEDYVQVRLSMESGVEVFCQADLLTPSFTQLVEIQGEEGTFMGSIQPDMPSFMFCLKDVAGYKAGKNELQFGQRNLFEAQMAEFVKAVRNQKKPEKCTIEDSALLFDAMEMTRKEIA